MDVEELDWLFFGGKLPDWEDMLVCAEACVCIVESVDAHEPDTVAHLVRSSALNLRK